jgi:hypothetical protein
VGLVALVAPIVLVAPVVLVAVVAVQRDEPARTEILWGLGDQLDGALSSDLYRQAPIGMVTSWYNGSSDLDWMAGYRQGSTMSDLYGQGKAQELVVYLAGDPQYAVSARFQDDIVALTEIFRGNGPHYGPLYVVLFSELETYSSNPAYFALLERAYLRAMQAIHATYNQAKVALGLGGYAWPEAPGAGRDLSAWDDALRASDVVATQMMQDCATVDASGQNVVVGKLRNAVRQLGTYGRPVMISHFKVWGAPECQTAAFDRIVPDLFSPSSLEDLTGNGLFAFGLMADHYVSDPGYGRTRLIEVIRATA